MTRDIHRRLDRLERAAGGTGSLVRLFFEPRPCADPDAFARQCETEAAEQGAEHVIVIRFVKPEDIAPVGAVH